MKQLNTHFDIHYIYIFISHALKKDCVLVAGSVLDLVLDLLNSEADDSPNTVNLSLLCLPLLRLVELDKQ